MLSRCFHFGVFEIFVSSLFLLVVSAFGEYWYSALYNSGADSQEKHHDTQLPHLAQPKILLHHPVTHICLWSYLPELFHHVRDHEGGNVLHRGSRGHSAGPLRAVQYVSNVCLERMLRKIPLLEELTDAEKIRASVNSFLGVLSHYCTYGICLREFCERVALYRFGWMWCDICYLFLLLFSYASAENPLLICKIAEEHRTYIRLT